MIEGLRGHVISILYFSWPTVAMGVIIAILLRVSYIFTNKKKFIIHEELFNLCFIIYILCLFYVVTFQDVSWASHNFIPFKEILRYNYTSKLFYKNVLGNVLLFVPFGYFINNFLKNKKLLISIVITMITSLSIELIQMNIGRSFDIDDIILNICGGCVGYLIYKVKEWVKNILPEFLKKNWIYNILWIILLIVSTLFLLSYYGVIKL